MNGEGAVELKIFKAKRSHGRECVGRAGPFWGVGVSLWLSAAAGFLGLRTGLSPCLHVVLLPCVQTAFFFFFKFYKDIRHIRSFLGSSAGKNSPTMQKTWVQSLGWEDPLEEGMATFSSILAWRIPWTEEPGRL